MFKHTLIAPVVLSATLLTGQAPQPPAAATRPATMDDIVVELRALRGELQQTAAASLRAQLLVGRLQVEEQRIAGIARQLAETEEQMRALEAARNPFVSEMLKKISETPTDPAAANIFAGVKAQFEKIENGDPVLRERHAALSRTLEEEQARWAAFNTQLEALERAAGPIKR